MSLTTKKRMDEIKRQMSIHRQNLLCVSRLSIKALIAQSQYQAIDDSCSEFKNFATIMEHILSHRLKGQLTWFGLEESRDFWHFIRVVCGNTHDGCINNVAHMESVRSSKAKGRAWLRIALMEKKLGDHLATALQNDKALRAFYGEGAFLRSEEALILVQSLQILNSLDFSCCVKEEKLETGVASVIDYAQFLKFQLSDDDHQEALMKDQQLFAPSRSPRGDGSSMDEKLSQLQNQYRVASAQKNYMEETANQKEQHLIESRKKIQTLENMVIQLQEQVASLKEAQLMSRRELEEHLIAGHWPLQERIRPSAERTDQDEIALDSISSQLSPGLSPLDQSSIQSFDPSSVHQRSISPVSSSSGISTAEGAVDPRTVPYTIPRFARKEKEETPSLIALAGSFTSQLSAMSVRSNETNSSGISENQPVILARNLSPDSLSAVSFTSASEASPMLT
ncbi:RUN domain-containing protein 3B [Strongylocentrotus purpuratus]|uniref:RUN domain-containing protein n=1 Tax=Strongylocentrotus purpuratus TaxID=7668 RepID=A0A7M7TGN7_STRPU|nr:RUN domain-containing protein 3B [Strongylocentrotus purpuratus]